MSYGDLVHLGHVELLTPELERSTRFFVEALGMEQEAAEGQSVFLRGFGDYQRYSVKLTEAPEPGLGHMAIRARDSDSLERLFVHVTRQPDFAPVAREILDLIQHP